MSKENRELPSNSKLQRSFEERFPMSSMEEWPAVVKQRSCLVDISGSVRTNPNTGVQGLLVIGS